MTWARASTGSRGLKMAEDALLSLLFSFFSLRCVACKHDSADGCDACITVFSFINALGGEQNFAFRLPLIDNRFSVRYARVNHRSKFTRKRRITLHYVSTKSEGTWPDKLILRPLRVSQFSLH